MSKLELLHLIFVVLWGGILLVELIMETFGLARDELTHVAKLHFWTDVLVEIPVVSAVLLTGCLLTVRAWPLSPLLGAKIAAALVAIALNLYCAIFVILRYASIGDPRRVRYYRKHVTFSAVGIPFGAVAAYLGFGYFS